MVKIYTIGCRPSGRPRKVNASPSIAATPTNSRTTLADRITTDSSVTQEPRRIWTLTQSARMPRQSLHFSQGICFCDLPNANMEGRHPQSSTTEPVFRRQGGTVGNAACSRFTIISTVVFDKSLQDVWLCKSMTGKKPRTLQSHDPNSSSEPDPMAPVQYQPPFRRTVVRDSDPRKASSWYDLLANRQTTIKCSCEGYPEMPLIQDRQRRTNFPYPFPSPEIIPPKRHQICHVPRPLWPRRKVL